MSRSDEEGGTRRPTVVTLSKLAGVAPSTVTRALRGDSRISKKTRDRILALAKGAGYTPNIMARTLSSGRNGLYGLVLGPQDNPFYAQILYEATAQAEDLGFRLLIIHAGPGPIEESTAQALLNYQVNGCLISSAMLSSQAGRICEENRVPLVMVNRVAYQQGCAVTCDNRGGGAELARHLLSRGRRSFGIIRTSNFSSTARDREEGFAGALAEAGLEVRLRYDGKSNYDGGFAAGEEIGLRVPEDVAVVGFDGLPQAARRIYDLTTIEQPLTLMLRRAFQMVEARMEDRSLPEEVVTLRGRLIARASG